MGERTHFLRAVAAVLLAVLPATATSIWQVQRDNLSEYRLISTKSGVQSDRHCVALADGAVAVHAAAFDAAGGSCSLFQCSLGDGGCRKCRNANNSSMASLWVRPLTRSKSCWTTFQHRVDASLSFNRNWTDYAAGFGQGEDANYWMGLETLYRLLSVDGCATNASCRIRWEFSDWSGVWYWVENTAFSVASYSDKYRLTLGDVDPARSSVGQNSLTNTFSPHKQQFSTPDSDNDGCSSCSCAIQRGSGWWFNQCGAMNPNGLYTSPPVATGGSPPAPIYYYYSGGPGPLSSTSYSMRSFELMLLTGV